MKPIQVYLEDSEVRRLKKLAIDKGITLSALIRLYIVVKDKVAKENPELVKQFNKVAEKLKDQPAGALCRVHGTPLDNRGRCLQKGCKYA